MPERSTSDRRWSVYIVRCRHGSLYTGIAVDVDRRIGQHLDGGTGAKYLRGRAPLKLVGHWAIGDRSLALRVERRIKRLDRAAKERLLGSPEGLAALLQELQPESGSAVAGSVAGSVAGCLPHG
jgi:putative endonuclease